MNNLGALPVILHETDGTTCIFNAATPWDGYKRKTEETVFSYTQANGDRKTIEPQESLEEIQKLINSETKKLYVPGL